MRPIISLLVASILVISSASSVADDSSAAKKAEVKPVKVVKLSPKVKQVARDFSQTSCAQLSHIKVKSQKEQRNLKSRKNQCVNQTNAFMKGY